MRMDSETDTKSNPRLSTEEKQFTVSAVKAEKTARVHSDITVINDYLLEHPEAEIVETNTHEGAVTSVVADIPLGLLKLSNKPRANDYFSGIVTNGQLEARDGE